MRQWNTVRTGEHPIDNRKREDILQRIKELAASYTPEWQFTEQNPDIGSVIALLFADQMQENIRRYDLSFERDHVELMNLLGISRRPARPARSTVLLRMVPDTIPGQMLAAGTKFLADGAGEKPPVFETSHRIYVTQSRISCLFMASGITGKIIPLKGTFQPVEYLQGTAKPYEIRENAAFTLFDFTGEDYGRTGLVMYHTHLFDETDNDIRMEILGADGLAERIISGDYRLSYYGREGFCRITDLRMEQENCLVFRKDGECRKVQDEGKAYSVLLLEPADAAGDDVSVSDIRFCASGSPSAAYVQSGGTEADGEVFYPFGRELSLFSELYIGHRYFANPGARITVEFELSLEEALLKMPEEEEDADLRIIRRKPKRDVTGAAAEVYADEVSFAYYNGSGWRRLPLDAPAETLFGQGRAGTYRISFTCPTDWQEMETGGYAGRCIRLQLLRSDNCYYRPAIHHCPLIRHLRIAYSYERRFARPQKLISFQGSRRRDLSKQFAQGEAVPLLFGSNFSETALYLGLTQKPEAGPVSLYFRIREGGERRQGRLSVSYGAKTDFLRLKYTDHTDGFTHTGSLLFMPPPDMEKRMIEGQEAYWLKITDEDFILEKDPSCRPVIEGIELNAVEVSNIETLSEEEYYIDACEPDMVFPAGAANILRADVWVNETGEFSESEMRQFMRDNPLMARAEYDEQGNIREFYIKWQEVENFDRSRPGDRHFVVDRVRHTIGFGDGANVRIPRNTQGPAFKAAVSRCDGARGNVPAGGISDTPGNVAFVAQIHNPANAFGGMDMETVEAALRRGTVMVNSRGRLVSAADYEREVLTFFHGILDVRVVTGVCRDGTVREGAVTIVVLMEDYQDGTASFLGLKNALKEHLLSRCELTVDPQRLEIVQPLFVEVSVEVWVRAAEGDDPFAVQQDLVRLLTDTLDPVKNHSLEIGGRVTEEQIMLRLYMEKGSAMIRKIMISGSYRDLEGLHETELKSLEGNPFMQIINGRHRIHFE